MFSLSKIKNKKSFFLSILLLSAFSVEHCYGMGDRGTPEKPFFITASNGNTPTQKESFYYKIGWVILPVAASAMFHFMLNKYNEDPELNNLNKEEKKIELELKKHPNYPEINLLHQKNEEETKANQNKQTYLALELQKAQLLEHHQEKSAYFLQCAENGSSQRERNYCQDMHERHNALIGKLVLIQ